VGWNTVPAILTSDDSVRRNVLVARLDNSDIAYAPWIRQHRWRFTIRTLLIVTTLVAVVLGLIVYAMC
jgi:hypothetical protein